MQRTSMVLVLVVVGCSLLGCPPREEESPTVDPCKEIFDIENPAGSWMWARGTSATPMPDTNYRIQFFMDGDAVKAWYVHDQERYELTGTRRETDWLFQGGPLRTDAEVAAAHAAAADAEPKVRAHAYLSIDKICHVEWTDGWTGRSADGADHERMDPLGKKTLAPVGADTVYSYHPCDGLVSAGKGAKSAEAAQELLDAGEAPIVDGNRGTFVAWSDAAADGGDDCTYSFDYFWDGWRKAEGLTTVEKAGDGRKWTHSIELNFVGSHEVTFERYRSCGGGDKELIGVSCGAFNVM